MERRVIDEEAVRFLAVFPQSFAVVACERDYRMVEEAPLLQERQQAPDLRVRERNLAVVEVSAIAAGVGFGRGVRKMGIVEVYPQKKRPGSLLEPAQRLIHHQVTAPLSEVEVGFVEPAEVEVVKVRFKSLI